MNEPPRRRFANLHDPTTHGPADMLGLIREYRHTRWERVEVTPAEHVAASVEDLRVTWVGHATALVQVAGLNVLTDPVWARVASPVPGVGPRRYADPGIRFEDLPPIDLVLQSHDHYDHLDRGTVRRLAAAHDPLFLVPTGHGPRLERWGARVVECGWWETAEAEGATATAVPAQHFSGRGLADRDRNLWCGWVLHTDAGRVYWAGDTGWSPIFHDIGARFAPIRLALLPIGAYAPRSFMGLVHVDPAQAVDIFEAVGAEHALAVHHATFKLTLEPRDEPARLLAETLAERGIPEERFRVLRHGGSWDLPPVSHRT